MASPRSPLVADPYTPDAVSGQAVVPVSAVGAFVESVRRGTPWAEALVTAIGDWTVPSEVVDGDLLTYLIAGEAFDWLLLAERLLRALEAELPDAVPSDEREHLLFRGKLPEAVTPERFREALGPEKYRAHLNYFYGVVVEEALWHAVERETEKSRGVRGLNHEHGVRDLVSQKLYRADVDALLRRFRREQGKRPAAKFSLTQWKEFSYWLFKLRVGKHDSARTASDTRKGLDMLEEIWDLSPHHNGGLGLFPRANG